VIGGGADARSAHLPVLYAQVMEGLRVAGNGRYLDGTFGRGGHARGVLEQLGPGGRLLLMDKDPEAIAVAESTFGTDPRVTIRRGSFADLGTWDLAREGLDGVLLDLGVSSPQLDVAERGFSFAKDGPLDMRMDPDSGESAAQWLARADEREIADVLFTYGEERQSRRIARPDANVHPERLAIPGHNGADPAVAEDSKRLTTQRATDSNLPPTGAERRGLLRQLAHRRKYECPRQFRGRVRRRPLVLAGRDDDPERYHVSGPRSPHDRCRVLERGDRMDQLVAGHDAHNDQRAQHV